MPLLTRDLGPEPLDTPAGGPGALRLCWRPKGTLSLAACRWAARPWHPSPPCAATGGPRTGVGQVALGRFLRPEPRPWPPPCPSAPFRGHLRHDNPALPCPGAPMLARACTRTPPQQRNSVACWPRSCAAATHPNSNMGARPAMCPRAHNRPPPHVNTRSTRYRTAEVGSCRAPPDVLAFPKTR